MFTYSAILTRNIQRFFFNFISAIKFLSLRNLNMPKLPHTILFNVCNSPVRGVSFSDGTFQVRNLRLNKGGCPSQHHSANKSHRSWDSKFFAVFF